MAQWSGQFTGHTHDTKVEDAELLLRKAIEHFSELSEIERAQKITNIQSLARRLLRARIKALRAQASALSKPGGTRLDSEQALHLRARAEELQRKAYKAS